MIYFIHNVPENRWFYASLFPLKELLVEYRRPWKLFVLTLGMLWLFYGALFLNYPDWDIGVSIIMGFLAYLLAPWSVSNFLKNIKYKNKGWIIAVILSLISWLFVVDWSYYLWHTYAGNTMIRYGNFLASSFLYLSAGFIWLYKGTFNEFLLDIQNIKIVKK